MTILIDVRSPLEYAGGHIAGAVNVPVEDISEGHLGQLAELPKDTLVQVYCLSGARAGYACELLEAAQFSNVVNLGGIREATETLR